MQLDQMILRHACMVGYICMVSDNGWRKLRKLEGGVVVRSGASVCGVWRHRPPPGGPQYDLNS